ncbi:MAG: nucleotide sugar dehydrogenase, partial [Caldilineaceae bacterium]|nr:nucleotide sugar dehydrogenase [Caldilineaceae bacterium]
MKESLIAKFQQRKAHIGIIGLGYVGLPLAVSFAQAGYRVTGIDLDHRKVDAINQGQSYIADVSSRVLRELTGGEGVATEHLQLAGGTATQSAAVPVAPPSTTSTGRLDATTEYAVLAECDAVSICVPTPLNKTGDPDISYIVSATEQIVRYLHAGMVIVLESTTYPGTTTEVLLPRLLENVDALQIGKDFYLAFSPERVDPGRTDWMTHNTPKVIGGITPACLEVAQAYYGAAIETLVPVSSPEAAEMVKLFENTFRSVNIGLANELLLMCDKLGLDAWEVIEAAATKPFGFMKFTPGPGLGGHCIPIDPHYLSWKLRTLHYNARFIELASEINTSMPRYWVQQVQDRLNAVSKPLKGSRVLVLGIAYKKDVSDMRESPALDIIHLLEEKGAVVQYHDPHVPAF